MRFEFVSPDAAPTAGSAIAVLAHEGGKLSPEAKAIDAAIGGAITRAIKAGRFAGAKGQKLDIVAPGGIKAARVLVLGAGKAKDFDDLTLEQAAASAYRTVQASGLTELTVRFGGDAARAAFGVKLGAYRFDRYRTTEKAEKKPSIKTVSIATGDARAAKKDWKSLSAVADGVMFTRDLVSEPANILFPVEFARRVKALEKLGLTVEILGEKEMKRLGMASLLGVGQGSPRESQLVVIQWKGAASAKAQPVAFVGKGVCFDSGGLSLKPAGAMEGMKWDMGGAGAVAGLMCALAGRKAKVNAVGILGLVENMPDGAAQRPGDVVKSMSGQTIEVLNTDAEGRLVLADALWYCQQRFKPQFMIDLATLTGAIITSLGHDYGGLFSNNDKLSENLVKASNAEGEPLWRLPLPDAYNKLLDSMIADMKNIGGPAAGSITAALFLQKFVNKTPWAHLDIASTAWKKPSGVSTVPDGATGYGVRLLNRMVQDAYEG